MATRLPDRGRCPPTPDPVRKSKGFAESDISKLWRQAVRDFEQSTGVQLDQGHKTASIASILSQITAHEASFKSHRHSGSRLDKFRTTVKNCLGSVELIGKLVAQGAKAAFAPSEVIYTAFLLIINTANSVSADYDRIESFFEDVHTYLCQITILEPRPIPAPQLKTAVLHVFTSILALCGICIRYTRTKRIVKAFRALTSGEDKVLTEAYQKFHKSVQETRDIIAYATFSSVSQITDSADGIQRDVRQGLQSVERIESQLDTANSREELQAVANWLSPYNFLDKQRDTFSKHHDGTGKWFLDSDLFQDWLTSPKNQILWCTGIPGAGKSVMLSTAVTYVNDKFLEVKSPRGDVAIVTVYCDYNGHSMLSKGGILSSITRQMTEQCSSVPPEVKTFRDRNIDRSARPSNSERTVLIQALCQRFKTVFVFLDALDECIEADRDEFVDAWVDLAPFARLLVTSRPTINLSNLLSIHVLHMDITADKSDMQSYLESRVMVGSRMKRFSLTDPNLRRDIVVAVLENADGMFLLAHLQVEFLCTQLTTAWDVRRALDSLSGQLSSFYGQIVTRIKEKPEHDKMLAQKVLTYIFQAARPLHINELLHALSIRPGTFHLERGAIPDVDLVMEAAAGLLVINRQSDTIHLAHFTVHEYLEKNGAILLPDPSMQMARACLSYLSFDELSSGPCGDVPAMVERLEMLAFLKYAACNLGAHLRASQSWDEDLIMTFLQHKKLFAATVQVMHTSSSSRIKTWHDRYPKNFGPLHMAAHWGVHQLLDELSRRMGDIDVDEKDSEGTTALHLASEYGFEMVAQWLLDHHASVNQTNNRGETPLTRAARNGHKTLVSLLMGRDADILHQDSEGWTAYHWAIIRGHFATANIILQRLDAPEFRDADGTRTAEIQFQLNKGLTLSAEAGMDDALQHLVNLGADVNWKDDLDRSAALSWASPEGHDTTVLKLLENGADANTFNNSNKTPLHYSLPHAKVAAILLAHGADVNMQGRNGRTALHLSILESNYEITVMILQAGADVHLRDKKGCSALHLAAIVGHDGIVRRLLELGADPTGRDHRGWTPLHAALARQNQAVVRILVDRVEGGQSIVEEVNRIQGNKRMRDWYENVAHLIATDIGVVSGIRAAASWGKLERLMALIESGVDLDEEERVGGCTALTVYTQDKHVRKILLEHGADPNKRARDGYTPLQRASENGATHDVETLLDYGAQIDAERYGWTALLLATAWEYYETAACLVRRGANVQVSDSFGLTALHWVVRSCSDESKILLRLLIEAGADVYAETVKGSTPIFTAIFHGKGDMVEMLVDLGVDIQRRDANGRTALHQAALYGHESVVRYLVQKGARVDEKDDKGKTATDVAREAGVSAVTEYLEGVLVNKQVE